MALNTDHKSIGLLVFRDNEIMAKAKSVPGYIAKLPYQIRLVLNLFSDYIRGEYDGISLSTLAFLAMAVGYFIAPLDLIPDALIPFGYIDDAVFMSFIFHAVKEDLVAYCQKRGFSSSYFFGRS